MDESATPTTVLVVCSGNVFRSAATADLLLHKLQEYGIAHQFEIISAGLNAPVAKTISDYPEAATALAERGIVLDSHQPKQLNRALLNSATLILTMSTDQQEFIREHFHDLRDRVWCFSELIGENRDIPDPYGQPLQAYRECLMEIDRIVNLGITRLLELAQIRSRNA